MAQEPLDGGGRSHNPKVRPSRLQVRLPRRASRWWGVPSIGPSRMPVEPAEGDAPLPQAGPIRQDQFGLRKIRCLPNDRGHSRVADAEVLAELAGGHKIISHRTFA
jgi:hypothetical protein